MGTTSDSVVTEQLGVGSGVAMSIATLSIRRIKRWTGVWLGTALVVGAGCAPPSPSGHEGADASTAAATLTVEPQSARAHGLVELLAARFQRPALAPAVGAVAVDDRAATISHLAAAGETSILRDGAFLHAASSSRRVIHRAEVLLPDLAGNAFHITDADSGVSLQVSLVGAVAQPAEVGSGYVVYRGALDGRFDVLHRPGDEGTEDYVHFDRAPEHPFLTYDVSLGDRVAGLRLVGNTVEFLSEDGAPRLRVAPPWLVDSRGAVGSAQLVVEGCAYDSDPEAPWGRAVTDPGARRCTVRVDFAAAEPVYPILLDPTWTATGSLAAARSRHLGVVLGTGNVLVAGGVNGGTFLASSELYNPGTGTWAATGAMTVARSFAPGVLMNGGGVFTCGGINGGGVQQTAEIYNGGAWAQTNQKMGQARYLHTLTVASSGFIYALGGIQNNGQSTNRGEYFDTTQLRWQNTRNPTASRDNHIAALLSNGRILIAGGEFCNGACAPLATSEIYDPAADLWAIGPAMSAAQNGATATTLTGGKILVAGGGTTVAELYDPSANSFTTTGSLTVSRYRHGAAALPDGRIVLSGGASGGTTAGTNTTDLYDPASGTTSATATLITARLQHVSVPLSNGKILVAGGENNGTATALCEVFDLDPNGTACTTATDCKSKFCVDGVCCNAACGGACDRCNVAGSLGTCSPVPAADPGAPICAPFLCNGTLTACPATCAADTDCSTGNYCNGSNQCVSKQANGAACTAANQCRSNFCVDGYCCNTACAGGCDYCNLAGTIGACTPAAAGNGGANPACGRFLCDGTNPACPATCATDVNCATGNYCNPANACVAKLPNASPCTAANQCSSGFCNDSVCCNAACTSGCDYCNLSGKVGTCTVATAGDPGANPACAPNLCNGTSAACPGNCSIDSDCTMGRYCDAVGVCQVKLANGIACTGANQCTSNFCVDGYCCNTVCAGSCDRCNLVGKLGACTPAAALDPGVPACVPYLCDGALAACPATCVADSGCVAGNFCDGASHCSPKLTLGSACTGGNQCQSSFCVDGVCCNAICNGACDVCNQAGNVGSCQVLAAGSAGAPSCTPFVCGGASAACPATCTVDANCINGDYCNALSQCAIKLGNGTACTAANQCSSGFCVDAVCCNAICSGQCDRCDLAATLGTCTLVAAGNAGAPSCAPFLCNGSSSSCPGACLADTNCVTGDYCNATNQCVPKLANGNACLTANQCQSTFCSDGYCCNSTCAGACQRCDQAGALGACTTQAAGTAGSPSCTPFLCDGATTGCPSTCTGDANCATNNYCNALSACVPKKSDGTACGGGHECINANCVDGVCCNAACSGGCDRCDQAGSVGTCKVLVAGASGSNPGCSSYLCDGANAACPTTCVIDANCVGGDFCDGTGHCVPKGMVGQACMTNNQCPTGFCVDGVCCGTACAGACDNCALPGSVGTCTPVTAGTIGVPTCGAYVCDGSGTTCPGACTSDANCIPGDFCNGMAACSPKLVQGSSCGAGNQCQSGFCVDGVCCNAICNGGCDRCDQVGFIGQCSIVASGSTGQNPSCGNFLCNGGSAGCPTSCMADANCVTGDYCNAQFQCVPKLVLGGACTATNQCSSGFCVDGVCCNNACAGQCAACNLAGTAGTCSPVTGAPVGMRVPCTTDGTMCGGACDGTITAVCAYPGNSTSCRAASCASGTLTAAASCNGRGACPAVTTSACAPFICGSGACLTSCSSDADCIAGDYCNSNSTCVAKLTNGQACTTPSQCLAGFCVDGVCCNSACNAQCGACNVAGALGTCSAVSGSPTGNRPACVTDGSVCGGRCDGINPAACAFPGGSTSCRMPSCATGTATLAATCDGRGACPTVTQPCTPYICGATACLTSCSLNTDCSGGTFCNVNGQCASSRPNGSACTAGLQCTSGFCTDGVCCNAACSGQCASCNQAGLAGTCVAVVGTPVGTRPACTSDGSACGGSCDGINQAKCAYPANTTSCRVASCASGMAQTAALCDGAGSCPPAMPTTCGAYLCGATACKSSCASDADCSSGNRCNASSQCVAKLANGQACLSGAACVSGNCVDGFCCNAPCAGQCEACNVLGVEGTCVAVAGTPVGARPACITDGSLCGGACNGLNTLACTYPTIAVVCQKATCMSGSATPLTRCDGQGSCPVITNSCNGYACNGTACNTSCVTDQDCANGSTCNVFGQCQLQRPNGSQCAASNQCKSTFCVDGVCCNAACSGQCASCNQMGLAGTCVAVVGTPVGGRPACSTDGSMCAGRCDGVNQSQCGYPNANVTCGQASCAAGMAIPVSHCDGMGDCPSTPMSCGAYQCANSACLTSCGADTDCIAGSYCNGNSQCVSKRANSGMCATSNQCTSGFCVDGFCCNAQCTGQCEACGIAGREGVCSPVVGPPVGQRPICTTDGSACAGACNGVVTQICTYPTGATSCRAASCTAGVSTAAATCDGAGHCPLPVTTDCAPYACGQIACLKTCSGTTDCAPNQFCGNGVCGAQQLDNGKTCKDGGQCTSGFCVDGVCCNSACVSQCAACNVPTKEGTCSVVTGTPSGGRPACGGTGLCASTCDGTNPLACAFPNDKTECAPSKCQGDNFVAASLCDGKGVCIAANPVTCSNGCQNASCFAPDALFDGSPDMVISGGFEGGGCNCAVAGHGSRPPIAPLGLVLLGLVALIARRRRA